MEFYEVFISFLAILKRSIKISLNSWKLLASITILSQFLISILILSFSCIFKSWISYVNDAFMEPYTEPATTTTNFDSPQSSTYLKIWLIFAIILVVEIAFIFVIISIYKFSSVAAILISVVSCGEKTLSLQDLISRIIKTWKRLQVFGWGWGVYRGEGKQYLIFVGVLGIIPWQLKHNLITLLIAIFAGVITLIFHMYFSVDLILARIVSVVEESSEGQEALKKSEQLIEGHKIQGFLLNILFNLLILICFLGYWMIQDYTWILNLTVFGLFLMNIAYLANIFALVAFTVLYSECKKLWGEEIEILGIMEYTKLSSNDIP